MVGLSHGRRIRSSQESELLASSSDAQSGPKGLGRGDSRPSWESSSIEAGESILGFMLLGLVCSYE